MNNNFVGQMPMQPVPQSQNLPQEALQLMLNAGKINEQAVWDVTKNAIRRISHGII